MTKTALVTGASSGIGKASALKLAELGFKVYGAARHTEKMKELETRGISVLSLDVTDDTSMQKCVSDILEKSGRLDVLVNNAGYGSFGAVEDVSLAEARRQFDVNVFGLARMSQLVLPAMRKQHSGRIINISSMGGRMYSPFGAWYHAAKYAVEGLSDCLRLETEQFGVNVVLVEPGTVKSNWCSIAAENLRKTAKGGPYEKEAFKTAGYMESTYKSNRLTPPEVIAGCVGKAATAKKPKPRYLLGHLAKLSVFTKSLVGTRSFDHGIKFFYGIK